VVFAPTARRVTAVHVALGQDPPGAELSSSGSGEASAPAVSPGSGEAEKEPAAAKAQAEEPKPKGHGPATPGNTKPGGTKKPNDADKPPASKSNPSSAQDASDGSPSKDGASESSKTPEGDAAGAGVGEAVLTTTSPQQLVQLKLKAEQQQLAHVGERAPVMLPGGGTVQGAIIEVGTVASESKGAEGEKGGPSGEGSGESTIPATLALDHRVAHLDQAPVSVELVKSVRRDVLAVPATALTATGGGGGGYAIEVLEGARRVELAVTPGMFANGYVQVEGRGLHEGQTVIEAE